MNLERFLMFSCFETPSRSDLRRRYRGGLAFYLGNSISSIETRSRPSSCIATLATLPSISEIPSSIPGFLIQISLLD
jgi:hypothetical protein